MFLYADDKIDDIAALNPARLSSETLLGLLLDPSPLTVPIKKNPPLKGKYLLSNSDHTNNAAKF